MNQTLDFKEKNLPEAFLKNVLANPKRVMFTRKVNGDWQKLLAEEALDFVLKTMQGLRSLGFQRGDRICIFSENREEWILTDYAAQWLGGSTTAIYTTSSADEVHAILKSSEARYLFVSNEQMLEKAKRWGELASLEKVILWEKIPKEEWQSSFVAREDFLKEAMPLDEAKSLLEKISPEDMAILLYTSGTTGEPKGVVLSQFNICSNIRQMHASIPLRDLHVTMSFLPLSHIYERSLQSTLLLADIKIAFAEGLEKLVDNMGDIKPDIMIGVPRLFEKMYVKVHEGIRSSSALKQWIARLAFRIGRATIPYRLAGQNLPIHLSILYALANLLVFKKIKKVLGGHLRYFFSGGAPLSKTIGEFFYQAGIVILEGYGLSETIILCYNRAEKIKFGTVGHPLDQTEFKIAEDGEILVRGPQIFTGYFKRPELNTEIFTTDGYFRTGDIGEIDEGQYLKITDRKKELLKTSGGKYIAPQPIENKLKADPLVENASVMGDGRKYVVALIVPNLELCKTWAIQHGESFNHLKACARSEKLKAHYRNLIDRINSELPNFSTIKYFEVLDQVFSIETGELTPTMKLKRRVIEKKYESLINSLYPEEDRISAIS